MSDTGTYPDPFAEWRPPPLDRIVWIQEGGETGAWHLGLVTGAEGEEGLLEDGRAWRSAKKDFV